MPRIGTVLGAIRDRQAFGPVIDKGAAATFGFNSRATAAGGAAGDVTRRIRFDRARANKKLDRSIRLADRCRYQADLGVSRIQPWSAALGAWSKSCAASPSIKGHPHLRGSACSKIHHHLRRGAAGAIRQATSGRHQPRDAGARAVLDLQDRRRGLFDLEIFWRGPYDRHADDDGYPTSGERWPGSRISPTSLPGEMNHHVAESSRCRDLARPRIRGVALRVKSFFVDSPKIGGIVGIGVHSEVLEDETTRIWSWRACCRRCSTSSAR